MIDKDRITAKEFPCRGYIVRPATNGGFMVELGDYRNSGSIPQFAGFTNSTDLLAFLAKGHAEYDKEVA